MEIMHLPEQTDQRDFFSPFGYCWLQAEEHFPWYYFSDEEKNRKTSQAKCKRLGILPRVFKYLGSSNFAHIYRT
jgi:hypothetical protein